MIEKSYISGNVWSPIEDVNPIYAYTSLWRVLSSEDERFSIFTWVITYHQCESFVCGRINQTRLHRGT